MRIRFLFTICILLSCVAFFLPASAQTEIQQASRKLAAISAARGVIDAMNSYDYPGLVEDTKMAIMNDTKIHSRYMDSEKEIRKIHASNFDNILNNNLSEILNKLDLSMTQDDFTALIYEKYPEKITENKIKYIEKQGYEAFTKGRQMAVKEQLDKISLDFYPDMKIVEDLQTLGWPNNQENEIKRIQKLSWPKL